MTNDQKDQVRELGAAAATGDQARALLGAALTRLHNDGYGKLSDISAIAGQRDQVESGLEIARKEIERLYAQLPPSAAALSATLQYQVGVALWFAADVLEREQGTAENGISYLQGFLNGLKEVLNDAGGVLPPLAGVLPWWVLPAVLLAAWLYLRRFLP